MTVYARVNGEWVEKTTGRPADLPSRFHEIVESGQAPYTPQTSEKTRQFLQAVGGGDSYGELEAQGIIFDKPVRVKPRAKMEMPDKFTERLHIPEEVLPAFRVNPGGFRTVEKDDGKFVVEPREARDNIDDDDGEDEDVEEEMVPRVSFDQIMDNAVADAKRRRNERLGL